MLKFLRIGVSALALSAFVVAPIMTVVTADYAYAKNGNGGGKGGDGGSKGGGGKGGDGGSKGGGGNGGGSKAGDGGGKSADKGHKGPGFGKAKGQQNRAASKGQKGLGRAIKDDFKSLSRNIKQNGIGGLFKQQKTKTVRSVSTKPTKTAPQKSTRPAVRASFKAGPMHPSNLGKLNGAINSSPKAKAAHIANGQYAKGTGPVSLAAALAVADYNYAEALDMYNADVASAQATLDLAMSLDDAQAVVDAGGPTETEVETAKAVLASETATEDEKIAAQAVVDAAQDVADAQDFIDNNPAPSETEIAEATDTVNSEPPSDADVIAAEDALLAHYKGDLPASEDPDMRLSTEEQTVVDAVRASNPDEATVEAALGTTDEGVTEETVDETDDLAGDDSTVEDTLDETDSAMAEEIETSEQG